MFHIKLVEYCLTQNKCSINVVVVKVAPSERCYISMDRLK